MADIDTGILRAATAVNGTVPRVDLLALCDEVDRLRAESAQAWAINRVVKGTNERLADKVDRLRAENTALVGALEDIAGMEKWDSDPPWRAVGECAGMNHVCHVEHPDDPGEWCPVCVAEICWCAWKMGVLGG